MMTKFQKMNAAMKLPRIPGREAKRQKAWAEYKAALTWWHPMRNVLVCQFVWMLVVVGVWG